MELFLIRHAQSENNRLWDLTKSHINRSQDPDLTEIGQRQSELLAEFLSHESILPRNGIHDVQNIHGFHLTHIYSSLMIRAVKTGIVTAEKLGLSLIGWEDLHEEGGIFLYDPGSGEKEGMDGKTREYFIQNFPGLLVPEDLGEGGWWKRRPYETEKSCGIRARRVVDQVLKRHKNPGDKVVLFTHGGFYNKIMKVILRLPDDSSLWFSINNCAITRIDFSQGERSIAYMNRIDFLPRDLVT